MTLFFKFFLLTCLFIVSSSEVLAQYSPTLKEGRKWINHYDLNGFGEVTAATSIIGDSLVNGVHYKVLRRDKLAGTFLMREDSVDRQIFLLDTSGVERLIYDFSLEPGDTCYCSYDSPTEGYVVLDSISNAIHELSWCSDSIVLDIPNPRIFHVRSNLDQSLIWIEGIGSNTELRDSEGMLYFFSFLLCHFNESGERDYHYSFGDCANPESCFDYVGLAENPAQGVTISPNPFADQFTVNLQNSAISLEEISIWGVDGQRVARYPMFGLATRTVDLSQLASGMWLITGRTKDGEFFLQKVLKQ
ncbi:MAG: T9SS type A sorting domain-containing protein [Bacteroidota bacterium]